MRLFSHISLVCVNGLFWWRRRRRLVVFFWGGMWGKTENEGVLTRLEPSHFLLGLINLVISLVDNSMQQDC